MQLLSTQLLPTRVADELDAEARLVEARLRLDHHRRAALFGTDYDSDEYDAAIMDFRRAQAHTRALAERSSARRALSERVRSWSSTSRPRWPYAS